MKRHNAAQLLTVISLFCLLCLKGQIAYAQNSQANSTLPGDKDARVAAILQAENLTPLSEYGRVVDQYGSPVSGAEVQGNVLRNSSFVTSSTEVHKTTTDSNGLFEFVGLHGVKLGIGIVKAGYIASASGFRKPKAGEQTTRADRETFIVWKLRGAEAMVHRNLVVHLPCDNTAIGVSLLSGKIATGSGDIIIRFARIPVQIVRGTPFSWTLTLVVPGGGLSEVQDPYPYEAPKDGYQETVTITTGVNPRTYSDEVRRAYYYKSPDGKFGRLSIDLTTDFQPPPTFFGIESYINVSGTNNLEYDRTKDPYAPQFLH